MTGKSKEDEKLEISAKTVEKTEKAEETKNFSDTDIIPEEVLEAIPEEDRGKVVSIIRQSMFSGITRRTNPIADKITPEHITTLIRNSDESDKRDRFERKSERSYNLILIMIGLAFIGFLIVFLQSNMNLLITIITAILSFIGGFGFGKSQNKDN